MAVTTQKTEPAAPVAGRVSWRESPLGRTLRRLSRSKVGMSGAIIITIFLLLGALAHVVAPYDPAAVDFANAMKGSSPDHLLGVDNFGRDLLSRIIYGARTSMGLAVVVVAIAGVAGVLIGTIAGYFGGLLDRTIVMVMDILMTFPSILVAMAVVTILGPGLSRTMLAIGISMTPRFVRLTRAAALQVRHLEYIQSARSIGLRSAQILGRHLLPNIVAPLIVQGSLLMAESVLVAAGLGFLGLGVQPPTAEWGQMLAEGRSYVRVAPHIAVYPGAAIMLMVLGFNLLGDGLRDAMDVRISR